MESKKLNEKIKLKDVLSDKGYIRGPFGSALRRNEMLTEGIPVYEQQNAIYDNRIFRYFIDENKYNTLERFTVKPGDLIISCSGTVGKVSIIKNNDPKGIISQALLILRVNENIILPEFLKYFFSSYEGYNSLVSRSTGSVQVNISKRQVIENIPISVPKLNVQKKIVNILKIIDKKIELNNEINNNLMELGYLIFKEYIINFKGHGGNELRYSDFGYIPKEWTVDSLLNIADYQNGLAMQKYRPELNEESIPVLKIKELRQGYCDGNSDICKANLDSNYVVELGDVIFAWSGSLMLKLWTSDICGLNQHLFKVTSEKYEKWFYFYWTQYYLNKFIKIAEDKATTMGHIKRTDLKESLVVIPDKNTYNKLNNLLKPLFAQIIEKNNEINKLTKIRDILLPKLMSGEIDVSDINFDLE